MESVREQMFCLDGPINVKGERGSSEYSYLEVAYRICDDERDDCKSREEISEWLKNKSIIILENEHKFLTDDYENPVRKQSRVELYKIVPSGAWKYMRLIRRFELLLSDHLLSIGLLFQD